jgi:uncharacterized RDD family membrane protein YckC
MDIALRDQYDRYETAYLLTIAKGDLTDDARSSLAAVLRERGVAEATILEARSVGEAEEQERANQEQRLASLPSRALAFVIDTWGSAFLISLVTLPLYLASARAHTALVAWLWFAYFLSKDWIPGGGSMGKRVLAIRVVDRQSGKPCTWGQSALRNAAIIIPFDWLPVFSKRRVRFGDMIVGTEVIRRKRARADDTPEWVEGRPR